MWTETTWSDSQALTVTTNVVAEEVLDSLVLQASWEDKDGVKVEAPTTVMTSFWLHALKDSFGVAVDISSDMSVDFNSPPFFLSTSVSDSFATFGERLEVVLPTIDDEDDPENGFNLEITIVDHPKIYV